jgi:5,10-methylenetetrahydrofolate reductase
MELALKSGATRLASLDPYFVSVTYWADGSTRKRSIGAV